MNSAATSQPPPIGLLAELTHRCPLGCAYCSNPLKLEATRNELPADVWCRVMDEAADLGVLQLHLSGGEPTARRDLDAIVKRAAARGLYTNLITSGIGVPAERMRALADAGLDHVQISIQDTDVANADRLANYEGAHSRKLALAREVRALGLPLTINAPLHRQNIDNIAASIWLWRMIRMKPNRSEKAPATIDSNTVGSRSANAMMPSQAGDSVSCHASQPTAVRFIQRPIVASVCPMK